MEEGMHHNERTPLEGEVLGDGTPDPDARDVTPGWITRRRDLIRNGRTLAQTLAFAVPQPHLRLALTAATIAADGLTLADDLRRGVLDGRGAGVRASRLALEGALLLAATRFAPSLLTRHRGRLAALRSVARRREQCAGGAPP